MSVSERRGLCESMVVFVSIFVTTSFEKEDFSLKCEVNKEIFVIFYVLSIIYAESVLHQPGSAY